MTVAVTGTGSDPQTNLATYATGALDLTADIVLTSVAIGSARNTKTFKTMVNVAAANPTDTILVAFTGTAAAIICTVTPNDGTNNSLTPVDLTTANLRELITTGAVGGKTVTITDVSSFRILQTATGGGVTAMANAGEGHNITATFTGGVDDDETPLASGASGFKTARFTSEKYSGTPETTESAQIRTDRMSSGQVVTGLTVNGGHGFELAKEEAIEDFLESAMLNAWDESFTEQSGTFAIAIGAKTITRSAGSWGDDGIVVGDIILLGSFSSDVNNVPVMVTSLDSDTVIKYAGPSTMVDASPEAATYQRAAKLTIGTTKKSLTVEKTFLDLTTKALVYRGCLVSQMELNVEYGALISGSFDTMGNDYDSADAANEFASYGEYIASPATTNTLNGSVDMPFLTTNVSGAFVQDGLCIQNLKLSLNNNLNVQNCIGRSAPENYSPGTAQIGVTLSSYLKDANWDMLARKLSQDSFALGFLVKNTDGWYGFYLPAIQVSFDDPASGGANQDISMEMTGTAKVGTGGVSALSIYKLPT